MSEALLQVFRESEKRGRAAFVGFVTAGYPTLEETADAMLGMERGGTDIIELGACSSLSPAHARRRAATSATTSAPHRRTSSEAGEICARRNHVGGFAATAHRARLHA